MAAERPEREMNALQPDKTKEGTKETGKIETVRLAQACKVHYENVIRYFNKANKHIKKETPIGALIEQGEILYHWKKQYELLPHDAVFRKNKLPSDSEAPLHPDEEFQQNKSRVEEKMISRLKNVDTALDKITGILKGHTPWRDVPYSHLDPDSDLDHDDTMTKLELEHHINCLTRNNQLLAHLTKKIGGRLSAKEDVSPSQATEEPMTNTEHDTIQSLARSCTWDYVKVNEKFKVAWPNTISVWMASYHKARCADESLACVSKQLKVFSDWTDRNGVFEEGDNSLDHRLRKPIPEVDDLSMFQPVNSHIADRIKEQLRSIKTTLAEISDILPGTRKPGENILASASDLQTDAHYTVPDDADTEQTSGLKWLVKSLAYHNEVLDHLSQQIKDEGPAKSCAWVDV